MKKICSCIIDIIIMKYEVFCFIIWVEMILFSLLYVIRVCWLFLGGIEYLCFLVLDIK